MLPHSLAPLTSPPKGFEHQKTRVWRPDATVMGAPKANAEALSDVPTVMKRWKHASKIASRLNPQNVSSARIRFLAQNAINNEGRAVQGFQASFYDKDVVKKIFEGKNCGFEHWEHHALALLSHEESHRFRILIIDCTTLCLSFEDKVSPGVIDRLELGRSEAFPLLTDSRQVFFEGYSWSTVRSCLVEHYPHIDLKELVRRADVELTQAMGLAHLIDNLQPSEWDRREHELGMSACFEKEGRRVYFHIAVDLESKAFRVASQRMSSQF